MDTGFAPLSLQVPPNDDPYTHIKGETLHGYVQDIAAISEKSGRDGETLRGRISGGPYERMTAQYILDRFRGFGLKDVHMETFPRNAQWWPNEWKAVLLADSAYGENPRGLVLRSAFPAPPSPSAPSGGIEGELVFVGMGKPADFAKSLLVQRFPSAGFSVNHNQV